GDGTQMTQTKAQIKKDFFCVRGGDAYDTGPEGAEAILDLLRWEATRPEIDLFRLIFCNFIVRSAATNSKIAENQPKNL
ncbi:MAG: hypothetical protein WCR52_23110, partial [Bacteroidota bacterium]